MGREEEMSLEEWTLDSEPYVDLLRDLVGEGKRLQNWPGGNLIPEEDIAIEHLMKRLAPHSKENGGPLAIEHVHLQPEKFPGRGNLIIRYPADADPSGPVVSFVGSHLDVVFADPASWERDPFTLQVEGDLLYGRGTTDCLGHCALLCNIFCQLATKRPDLNGLRVVGVLICDEEAGGSVEEVGVEGLQKKGYLADLKSGPLIWLDCADKQPNVGSGGVVQWSLTVKGKLGYSGFPHKGINSIELANDALVRIQSDFYETFPTHPNESVWGFECSSSMKPTRGFTPDASLNQIPGCYTLQGDIRLVPFYKIQDAMKVVENSVAKLNDVNVLKELSGNHGNESKYVLFDSEGNPTLKASLTLEWLGGSIQGIACSLDSPGFVALSNATKEIVGHVQPIADTGSLPLVADLKEDGFDVQTVGYGVEDVYHADNEFCRLSDFQQGFRVLMKIINTLKPQN